MLGLLKNSLMRNASEGYASFEAQHESGQPVVGDVVVYPDVDQQPAAGNTEIEATANSLLDRGNHRDSSDEAVTATIKSVPWYTGLSLRLSKATGGAADAPPPPRAPAAKPAPGSPDAQRAMQSASLCGSMPLLGFGSNAAAKVPPHAVRQAAWRGDAHQIRTLLAVGGNVHKKDKSGLAALHYAAWQGHVDAALALLECGADVNAQDAEGLLPLHYAAWMGHSEMAALLLDHGSAINPDAHMKRRWSLTPLAYAAKMGHMDTVELLLTRGATLEGPTKEAGSALHEAAWEGQAGVVALMLARCPGGASELPTPASMYRPLHLAALEGHAPVVEALVAGGAAVDARAKDGRTPLHLAARTGRVAALRALVAAGADLDARDKDGFAPLHLAVDQGHLPAAMALLALGADPGARTVAGAQPLAYARDRELSKLLSALRWYGAPSAPPRRASPAVIERWAEIDLAAAPAAAAAAVATPAESGGATAAVALLTQSQADPAPREAPAPSTAGAGAAVAAAAAPALAISAPADPEEPLAVVPTPGWVATQEWEPLPSPEQAAPPPPEPVPLTPVNSAVSSVGLSSSAPALQEAALMMRAGQALVGAGGVVAVHAEADPAEEGGLSAFLRTPGSSAGADAGAAGMDAALGASKDDQAAVLAPPLPSEPPAALDPAARGGGASPPLRQRGVSGKAARVPLSRSVSAAAGGGAGADRDVPAKALRSSMSAVTKAASRKGAPAGSPSAAAPETRASVA